MTTHSIRMSVTAGVIAAASSAVLLAGSWVLPQAAPPQGRTAQSPAGGGQQPPAPQAPQQPQEIDVSVSGSSRAPRLAVPDFLAPGAPPDVAAAVAPLAETLWEDLRFEREYDMIPRAAYKAVAPAASADAVPFDQWRELGANFVLIATARGNASSVTIQARLYDVNTRQAVWGKEYTGTAANPRLFAHTISDELHEQRGLKGVARTKLAFASDRDGVRASSSVENRNIKEIYIGDYDGENQRRVTVNRSLAINPAWSADGRAIAYTSYRRGYPDIYVSYIYQGRMEQPTKGTETVHNFLPAFSPDGTKLAFMTNRDGNMEIYSVNRDGSNLRRVTRHPGNDTTPTWSPAGNQIAFTSDRTGAPQLYIVDADGVSQPRRITSESWADRATWSPIFSEIAYAGRTGPGFDIKIVDITTGAIRVVTDGVGSNESPAWAPNGRHLAFASTRAGRTHIFTVARDGQDLRQLTRQGNNVQPSWSH